MISDPSCQQSDLKRYMYFGTFIAQCYCRVHDHPHAVPRSTKVQTSPRGFLRHLEHDLYYTQRPTANGSKRSMYVAPHHDAQLIEPSYHYISLPHHIPPRPSRVARAFPLPPLSRPNQRTFSRSPRKTPPSVANTSSIRRYASHLPCCLLWVKAKQSKIGKIYL